MIHEHLDQISSIVGMCADMEMIPASEMAALRIHFPGITGSIYVSENGVVVVGGNWSQIEPFCYVPNESKLTCGEFTYFSDGEECIQKVIDLVKPF